MHTTEPLSTNLGSIKADSHHIAACRGSYTDTITDNFHTVFLRHREPLVYLA